MGRKRKSEVLPPSYRAHRAMPLNTPGDALREMGRIYRASCNGHLATEEMTRFMYALDKIRVAVEAAAPIIDDGGGDCVTEINIVQVPSGHMFCPDGKLRPWDEGEKLWNEHNGRVINAEPEPPIALPQIEVDDANIVKFELRHDE